MSSECQIHREGKKLRKVCKIIPSGKTHGDPSGVVHRSAPEHELAKLNPFLLVTEIGPIQFSPGEARGAPLSMLSGLETLSYIIEGGVLHEDSAGRMLELNRGDLLRVTAGHGITQSRMPLKKIVEEGGVMHVIRIWSSLPADKKVMPPSSQAVRSAMLPTSKDKNGVMIKLLSGRLGSMQSKIENHSPVVLAQLTLPPSTSWNADEIDASHTTLIYILSGDAIVSGDQKADRFDLVHFDDQGGSVRIENPSKDNILSFFIMTGRPL